MRIEVDLDLCEANGRCVDEAPGVFTLDDEDELHVNHAAVSEELRDALSAAVRRCPRRALALVEE